MGYLSSALGLGFTPLTPWFSGILTQTGIAPPALLSLLLVDGRSWHFSDSIIHEPIPHSKGKEKRARVRIREREREGEGRERERKSLLFLFLWGNLMNTYILQNPIFTSLSISHDFSAAFELVDSSFLLETHHLSWPYTFFVFHLLSITFCIPIGNALDFYLLLSVLGLIRFLFVILLDI